MKPILPGLALVAACLSFATGPAVARSSLEDEVMKELNFARTKPAEYARELRAYRSQFQGRHWRDPGGGVGLMTNEGARAVDEAIAALSRQEPLDPLKGSGALANAAFDHARDTGPIGLIGHRGSDRSMPERRINRYASWRVTMAENISYGHASAREVVRQLIVDDGVRDRAHRRNIFNPAFTVAGVGCAPHRVYRHMCVIDFAGGVGPKMPDKPQGVSWSSYNGGG